MNKKISVALADDSIPMRSIVRSYLVGQGIEIVFECSNGKQLLDYLGTIESLPDVCILDAAMPVLSGYATAKKLLVGYPRIGIIGFSYFDERSTERMIGNGADICIDKGNGRVELVKAIKTIAARAFA